MFEAFRNAFKIHDLRRKILFALFMIIVYRLGCSIPVPLVDPGALSDLYKNPNEIIGLVTILTGLDKMSVFAMGVSPYITSSIIMQLLTVAIPYLERLQKEGEEGRKKIAKITRYVTVLLGVLQSYAFYTVLRNTENALTANGRTVFGAITIIGAFTAGTALVMWLGEQINDKGIGNGISLILTANIVSRGPEIISSIRVLVESRQFIPLIVILLIAVAMITSIVHMNEAERRIPIQYAKRVVGRRMYGGQSTHLPIKLAMSGVIPIIFASTILSMPSLIGTMFNISWLKDLLTSRSWVYPVLYFLLILFFNYFYVSIQYDTTEISNNIQKNGGFVPGIRPGENTVKYINKILNKTTLLGAVFLGIVAVLPLVLSLAMSVSVGLAGTSVLIIVSVVLETARQIESQMVMRHYKGFLE